VFKKILPKISRRAKSFRNILPKIDRRVKRYRRRLAGESGPISMSFPKLYKSVATCNKPAECLIHEYDWPL
jgi:hypothetical protein